MFRKLCSGTDSKEAEEDKIKKQLMENMLKELERSKVVYEVSIILNYWKNTNSYFNLYLKLRNGF